MEKLIDYQLSKETNIGTGEENTIDFPKSNVLQFVTEDGSKISARPSGTEPKIKFYFGTRTDLDSIENFDARFKELGDKIDQIINDLNLG